jgi:hypothetical protein
MDRNTIIGIALAVGLFIFAQHQAKVNRPQAEPPAPEPAAAVTPEAVAERFSRAPRARVQEILQALGTLGMV